MADEDGDRKRSALRTVLIVALLLGGAVFAFGALGQFGSTEEYTITRGTHYNASEGPEVELNQTINTTAQHPFSDNHTVGLPPHGHFSSDGATNVKVTGIDSSWTTLEELDVSEHELESDLSNKQTIEVSGETRWIEYRDMGVDDGQTDFRYGGPDGGTTQITIHDLPADSTIVAWDPSTEERLDFGTTDSNGVLTLTLPQSEHDVELRSPNEPITVDGTAAPSGGVSTSPDDLSVDVDHEDFPDTSVDADFYLNGEHVGSDSIEDTGTVSTTLNESVQGGSNNWTVSLEDDYGNVVNRTYDFQVPNTLQIYNETSPSENISDVDVQLRFYFEDGDQQVIQRTSSNGSIDMEGLPIEEPFVVVAEADGYHPRRIYVDNLFDSQAIYLLPENAEYVDLTFDYEDFSGRFPSDETVMTIEKEINGDWRTVQGDFFGASSQFTAQLEHNTRHRLTLINTETGETRRLGTLTPTTSGVQTIEVTASGEIDLAGQNPVISISPSTRSLAAIENASVGIDVSAGNKQIDEWTATVSSGGDVLHEETVTGESGSISPTFNLSDRDGGQVTVDVEIVLEDGTTISESVSYGIREHYDHEFSLLSVLTSFKDILPGDGAATFLAVACTVLITGAVAGFTRVSSEALGGVAVGSIAFFSLIGWVGMGLLFAAAVTWITAFALRRGI